MNKYSSTSLLVAALIALLPATLASADDAKQASDKNAPPSAASAELDKAFAEFKAAADRLGKSMAKAANENTVEARQKIMHTMSGAVRELGQTMNQASQKLESKSKEMAKDSKDKK
jgi:hypothetical protein